MQANEPLPCQPRRWSRAEIRQQARGQLRARTPRMRTVSARRDLKAQNVERDNRVAVSVADSANAWRYVLARGTIVERRHEGADAHIDRLAKKYLGKDTYPFR